MGGNSASGRSSAPPAAPPAVAAATTAPASTSAKGGGGGGSRNSGTLGTWGSIDCSSGGGGSFYSASPVEQMNQENERFSILAQMQLQNLRRFERIFLVPVLLWTVACTLKLAGLLEYLLFRASNSASWSKVGRVLIKMKNTIQFENFINVFYLMIFFHLPRR